MSTSADEGPPCGRHKKYIPTGRDEEVMVGRAASMPIDAKLMAEMLCSLPKDIHIVGCHYEPSPNTATPGVVVLHLEAFEDDTFPSPRVSAVMREVRVETEHGTRHKMMFVRWEPLPWCI